MKARISISLVLLLVFLSAISGQAQGPDPQMMLGTPFTYQGVLRSNNTPVSGTCDFQFSLWDAASSGSQIGATWPQADVAVTRGLFTVLLDFGASPFQGANRYLEIAVRCPAGSGGYTTLTPRQPLTPAPYALYANAAHWSSLLGIPAGFADNVDNDTTYTAGAGLTLVGTQFSVVFAGTGAANTVARSDHNHDAAYWKLNGNGGTTPGVNYLGTSDNTALELKVNNVRALRLEPNTTAPNIIAGYPTNAITAGVAGATIAGGGISTSQNRVTDQHGTIGGGAGNVAGNDTGTTIDAVYATISGGWQNTASGSYSSIGGGWGNIAVGIRSAVGGGEGNTAAGSYSAVGGGNLNQATNERTTVAGGASNLASGHTATVGGGATNTASGSRATISGGQSNTASNVYATVGGGQQNLNQGQYATVSGGYTNTIGIGANYATIGGGQGNVISNTYAVIAGGYHNSVSHDYAAVGGGYSNVATGQYAAIGGGMQNTASAPWSAIPGGNNNTAAGSRSFAAGNRAKANHMGAFVWADATDADIASTANNQFIVRASGGIWLGTNSAPSFPAGRFLNTSTGAYLSSAGNWTNSSDRALKDNFTAVDGKEILARLSKVPILGWNYKAEDASIRHIGPVAQDFYAAFGVGQDDTHISTVDADGVALAALQGAYQLIQEKDAQIAAQQAQIDDLASRLAALESLVAQLAAKGEGR